MSEEARSRSHYRLMYSLFRLLQNRKIMIQKLRAARSVIDNKRPKQYSHITNSSKGKTNYNRNQRFFLFRSFQIQRDNLLLLQKIATINNKKPKFSYRKPSPHSSYQKKTLQNQIKTENQTIVKNLVRAKSYYSHKQLLQFSSQVDNRLKNISIYSPIKKNPFQPVPTPAIRQQFPQLRKTHKNRRLNSFSSRED